MDQLQLAALARVDRVTRRPELPWLRPRIVRATLLETRWRKEYLFYQIGPNDQTPMLASAVMKDV